MKRRELMLLLGAAMIAPQTISVAQGAHTITALSPLAGATGTHLARRLISVAAMFLGALAGALLVLHVHIVYPLVIALVILAAVAIIAVAWARNPRTTAT